MDLEEPQPGCENAVARGGPASPPRMPAVQVEVSEKKTWAL